MEIHAEIRRGVNSAELSLRQACSLYHLNFRTVGRLVASVEPVAYQQVEPRPKPVLGPFLDIIASILQARGSPRPCQTASHRSTHLRSPSPRARLHHTGCASIVRAAVADYKQSQAEVYVPLLHPPGEGCCRCGRWPPQGRAVRLDLATQQRPLRRRVAARMHGNLPRGSCPRLPLLWRCAG
jgi:hypothetical protein